MNLLLIAVKDTAIEAFQAGVHVVRARGEALRHFTDAINDPNNKQLNNHAADFELWILGELNDQTGEIIRLYDNGSSKYPERLARGTDVKNT